MIPLRALRLAVVPVVAMVFCGGVIAADSPFVFRDTGDEAGAFPHVAGIRGHGAAWGDVDGDGFPELFVTTFHNAGSKPSMLLRNDKGKFRLDDQALLATSGLGSGALFVDLNNTGRLDLYVSNCAHGKEGVTASPSSLFRNDGGGKFTDISKESGACLPNFAGRGLSAADIDGDGLLDLILCERYYGKVNHGPAILRNLGNHRFENVSKQSGIPEKLSGLAVAVADLNGDGAPDLFFTEGSGDHRLMINDGKGKFSEAPNTRETFRWKPPTEEDTPAGVCIGDVNRDNLPDIVIGHHYKAPWKSAVSVRLYLQQGAEKNTTPHFKDVTEAAGLKPLAMKGPHVEIQDFDNDGLPDLYVSIVKFKDGKPHPLIYKNTGNQGEIPQFKEFAWGVNDFPTQEDTAIGRSGTFFEKLLKEKKIIYMAAGPTGDYDRDGRIDLFLANWWNEDRSLLLKNETPGGNWLDVQVQGSSGGNRMGIGAKVHVFKAGTKHEVLGSREITIGQGFCSGQEAIAHFGLGKEESVDVIVTARGIGIVEHKNVKANQRLVVRAAQ